MVFMVTARRYSWRSSANIGEGFVDSGRRVWNFVKIPTASSPGTMPGQLGPAKLQIYEASILTLFEPPSFDSSCPGS
jgi:hypothetical protein